MHTIAMLGLALLVGLIIPFQGIVTASLSQKLEHPFLSAFVNFFGGLLVFVLAMVGFIIGSIIMANITGIFKV